jgi:hypothetical protein
MTEATPPRWAEALLGLLLSPRDRQTVTGDLLEEYRKNIHPRHGRRFADRWYARQVAGFALRASWLWAFLLSASFIARTALDWFVPTDNFYSRSIVTTVAAVSILLSAGFCATWQSSLLRAGSIAGIATTLFSGVISIIGTASLLAIRHDASTIAAIQSSGGLAEVFTLPLMLIIPGTVLGTIGGTIGALARRALPYTL